MARKPALPLEERIKHTEEAVAQARVHYDELNEKLKQLKEELDNERREEVFKAISRSKRSYSEILAFIRNTDL